MRPSARPDTEEIDMAKHLDPEAKTQTDPDDTRRIPMTSPRGTRTRLVPEREARELETRGWYRSKLEW